MLLIQPVNDRPVVDLNGPAVENISNTVTFTEEGSPVELAPDGIIIDVESTTLANLTVEYSAYAQDVITVVIPADLSQEIEILPATDPRTSNIRRVVSPLSGDSASISSFEAYLNSFAYGNNGDEIVGMNRMFNFFAHDGLNEGDESVATVEFIRINDAPEANPPGPFNDTFSEELSSLLSGYPEISITDDDHDEVANATVVLDGILNVGESLMFTGSFTSRASEEGSTATSLIYTVDLSTLNLTSASTLFSNIVYVNPAAEPLLGVRTINVTIRDPAGAETDPVVLSITIKPFNDNPPAFTQDTYTACVPEGARNFLVTDQIDATDADSVNQPQSLSFSFICPGIPVDLGFTDDNNMLIETEGTAAPIGSGSGLGMNISRFLCEIFSINETTGVVTTCGGPQCAAPRRIILASAIIPLNVSDGVFSSESSSLNLTIVESNRNAPVFIGPKSFTIEENDLAGAQSVQISAVDGDVFPPNNVIQYDLADNLGGQVSINAVTGLVSFTAALDFEVQCEYTLTVSVADGVDADPMCFFGGVMGSSCNFTVFVANVNEFDPVLPPFAGPLMISETMPINTFVISFLASDGDSGCPQRGNVDADVLTYSLQQSSSALFQIDSMTGNFTLASPLDHETATMHELNVTVTDNGMPPRSTSLMVTVMVVNENDNAPQFLAPGFAAEIFEATIISQVITFAANDVDNLNPLQFSLVGNPPSFAVNAASGILSVINTDLDFETKSFITFTVNVTDGTFSATAPVNITLLDLNDNMPMLVGLQNNTYTIKQRPIQLQPTADIVDQDSIHAIDGVTVSLVGAPLVTQRLASELPCDCNAPVLGTCPNVTAVNVLEFMTGPVPVVDGVATFGGETNFIASNIIRSSLVQGFVVSACIRPTVGGYLLTIPNSAGVVAFGVEITDMSNIILSYLSAGVRVTIPLPAGNLFDGQSHSFNLEFRFPEVRLHVDQQMTPTVVTATSRPDGLPTDHLDLQVGCHGARCFQGEIRAFVIREGVANLLHLVNAPGRFNGNFIQFDGQLGNHVPIADLHVPGFKSFSVEFGIRVEFELDVTPPRERGVLVSYGRSANWILGVIAEGNVDGGTRAAFSVYHRRCTGNSVAGNVNNFFDFNAMGADITTGRHEVIVQYFAEEVVVILDRTFRQSTPLGAGQEPCFRASDPNDPDSFVLGAHLRPNGITDSNTRLNGRIYNLVVRADAFEPDEFNCLQNGCGNCRCGARCSNLTQCTAGDVTAGCRFDISKYGKCGIEAVDFIFLSGAGCTSGQQMLQLTASGPNHTVNADSSGLTRTYEQFSGATYFSLDPGADSGVIFVAPGVGAVMIFNRTTIVILICVVVPLPVTYTAIPFTIPVPLDNGLHHIAFSVDQSTVTAYLDGNSLGSQPKPASSGTYLTGPFYLGFWPRSGRPRFVGTLNALTFTNSTLTDFDVRCVESCGTFLRVGALPAGIFSATNLSTTLSPEIVLTGNVFENIYGGVLRTLTYYNLFSEPPLALPFDVPLRIDVFDNGAPMAAETAEPIITIQAATPPVVLAGGDVSDFTVIVENGAPAQLVADDVQVLLPVEGTTSASIRIERTQGGCPFGSSLSLLVNVDPSCASLTIINDSLALLSSTDALNTLRSALLLVRCV